MPNCVSCGYPLPDGFGDICAHHHAPSITEIDWAERNRIACDLFHRHRDPPRVPLGDLAYLLAEP